MSALTQWLLTSLEVSLNRLIAMAPVSEHQLSELEGRSISFAISEPFFQGTLYIADQRITLHTGFNPSADARIQGPAAKLIKLHLANASPVGSGVRISGDQSVLIQLQQWLRLMDIDWEEPLAKLIGDIPAQQAGSLGRSLFSWAKSATGTLANTGSTYLMQEATLTARPERVAEQLEAIDQLQADTERLSIRVGQLQQSIQAIQATANNASLQTNTE